MSAFQIKDFTGLVILQEWCAAPDGQQYSVFAGKVSIFSAEEATGFALVTERNANWFARVEGETEAWNFPGCQVRAVVHASGPRTYGHNTYEVK